MRIVRALLIALGVIGMSADRTWSEPVAADYPHRQVNFIVPFAPGGSTDILGRLLGQKLSERFGKPFVIENRLVPALSRPRSKSQKAPPMATPS